jgi:hypothetical protein
MNPILLQDFILLIANHTGMQIQDRDRIELVKKLESRVLALKLSSTAAYYQLLSTTAIAHKGKQIAHKLRIRQELNINFITNQNYFRVDN